MTTTSTTATYTAEQIEAIGGRRWERGTRVRVYLNDWTALLGIEVDRYGTGNLRSVAVDGEHLSNRKAAGLLSAKVWWENGRIVTDLHQACAGVNLDGADYTARLHDAIAAKVGA